MARKDATDLCKTREDALAVAACIVDVDQYELVNLYFPLLDAS